MCSPPCSPAVAEAQAPHAHGHRVRPSRILYVSAASPVPSKIGPARRNFHIVDQLARFFDLSVLSIGSEDQAKAFVEVFGDRVREVHFAPPHRGAYGKFVWKLWRTATHRCDFVPTCDPGLRRRCTEVARASRFDAIVLSCVLLRGLPLPVGVPIIGDTHNVEFDVLRRTAGSADDWMHRAYASAQWRATRREERRATRGVDLLLATSARDRRVFERELGVPDVAVVANGIDLREFALAPQDGEPGVILFSGLMSYYPNQQAIRWFLDRVLPTVVDRVPGARLIVAGAAPPQWLVDRSSSRVQVTGAVPDMRPYLEMASVFVAPLQIGGGTRVKILEAQASGRPVVSTSIGAEGLDAIDGASILLADAPEAFAQRIIEVLTDRSLAHRIALAGRRHVEARFDWDGIGERLGRLLQRRVGLVPHRGCGQTSNAEAHA